MLQQLRKICRKRWMQFARSESGVSAIEMVFIGPFVFLFLGVIIETGFMLFTQISLQAGVDDAARSVRTGSAQMASLSSADFKTKVCNTIGSMIDCAGSVTVYVRSDPNYATMRSKLPPLINIGPTTGVTTVSAPACYNPGAPLQPVIIVATYDWYFVSLGMGAAFGNVSGNSARRLTAQTVFQNQNYPGTNAATCP